MNKKKRRKETMTFTEMRNKLMGHFAEMVKDVDHLFEVEVGFGYILTEVLLFFRRIS